MRKLSLFLIVPVLSVGTSAFGATVTGSVFASGTAAGVMATGPDSVTAGNGSVWIAYSNGADSAGGPGANSLVVQYSPSGSVLHTYSLPGYVDGLKINPSNGKVWALQNQDGNSTLTIIDPVTNTVGTATPYSVTSTARGYDDVAFNGNKTFLSYTNPSAASDPIIQQLVNGSNPLGFSSTVLTMGASGTNLATGMFGPITGTDPDSLKSTLTGGIMLTSGSDGQLIFVGDPGGANTVSFLQLLDPSTGGPVTGLDDAISPNSTNGTFYVADTKNNRVLALHATGLAAGSLFASVGSLNEFALVNTGTGVVSPFVTSVNGVNLSAPHGIDFVADTPEPATSALVGLVLFGAVLALRRRTKVTV